MAKARRYSSPYLSDIAGGKVVVSCQRCGLERRYDSSAMLERIGDVSLPELRIMIARAEGCPRADNVYRDRCELGYDPECWNGTRPKPTDVP